MDCVLKKNVNPFVLSIPEERLCYSTCPVSPLSSIGFPFRHAEAELLVFDGILTGLLCTISIKMSDVAIADTGSPK
jgi:hypothetical protein